MCQGPDKSVPARYVDTHGDKIPEHYYVDQYHRTVDDLVKRIVKAGIKYEGICGVGDPQDVILKSAKSRDVNYIVVGTRGLRRLNRLRAIGNVARNVIENSTIPVLAIP
jgi:nucleotide-binding universal stress UspA family protein